MDILSFLEGRVILSAEKYHGAKILTLLQKQGVSHYGFRTEGERVRMVLSTRGARRLRLLCEQSEILLAVEKQSGFPQLLASYGRRLGIWVGLVACAGLIWASSSIVWDVRVSGNQALDEETVVQMLSECGLGVGTALRGFDKDKVEFDILTRYREIDWISVNIRGTTVNVEIKETSRGEIEDGAANDLVAARDGQIERIEAYDGNVCVRVGDVVREGEVLVSGLYEDLGTLRTSSAKGEIYARTVRVLEVEIPLEDEKKVYTGGQWTEKAIIFFSKSIKVFSNTGNVVGECDIIQYNSHITMPGNVPLPIGWQTISYRAYRTERERLSETQAMEKAFARLEYELERLITETEAELRRKTVTCELTEESFRIRCTVECVENIAKIKKIDIS